MPNSPPAKASAEPHWPAPVSVESLLDALLLVVPGLRHRGIRLVRARRRDAFVLEIDLGRRLQRLFQPARADERRRPPHAVDVADRLRDVDGALRRHLLQDQRHREQRLEIGGADRLLGAGMQNRRQRLRQIGRKVVPSFRNLCFVENEFDLTAHATPPRWNYPGTIHQGTWGGNSLRPAPPTVAATASSSPSGRWAGRPCRRCLRGIARRRRVSPSR